MAETKKRREMTPAWKQRVLDVLAANKRAGKTPGTLAALAKAVDADKRGIYITFETDQTSSSYVDAICDLLGIDPPLQAPIDAHSVRVDEHDLRALSLDEQAAVLRFANDLTRELQALPAEHQEPIRKLILTFLADFFTRQNSK